MACFALRTPGSSFPAGMTTLADYWGCAWRVGKNGGIGSNGDDLTDFSMVWG